MKYYCIGIKGAGMSTLAQLLFDLGHEVVGYDDVSEYKFTQEGLDSRGIKIYNDQSFDIPDDFIVTHSVAFKSDHKEIKRIHELRCNIKAYCEIIGDITKQFKTIGISGTHGKTSTCSMVNHLLKDKGCNYFIGDGSGYMDKNNSLFVLEADEFNKHFLAYYPTVSVITNIELEHTECYDGIEDIKNCFREFANKSEELIVACGDNENVRDLELEGNVLYYGFNDDNDYIVKNVHKVDNGNSFDLYYVDEFVGTYVIPVFGNHMVLNATASIIVAINYGIDNEHIVKQLSTFVNAKRRFAESIVKDIIIVDDYAHHPTEIKVTLEAAKEKYPNKKIIAVFKPNTYSRTKEFPKEFADSLSTVEKAYITPIDCNRERSEDYDNVTSETILEFMDNGELLLESDISKLVDYKDVVIVFLSCASVKHMIDDYTKLKLSE